MAVHRRSDRSRLLLRVLHKPVLYLLADDLFDRATNTQKSDTRSQALKRLVALDLLVDDWFRTAPSRDLVTHLHALIDRITAGTHTITGICADSMRQPFTTHESANPGW